MVAFERMYIYGTNNEIAPALFQQPGAWPSTFREVSSMGILPEEWRVITRAPDYAVSNMGEVRRITPDRCGRKPFNLSKSPDRHGHQFVTLSMGHKAGRKTVRIAINRTVYAAFIGQVPDGHRIKHRDGDKSNCRPDNLFTTDRPRVPDFAGQRFGYWTALEFAGRGKGRTFLWLCRCDCGTSKVLGIHHLRYGFSQSCGCKSAELTREKVSGPKHYSWKGGVKVVGSPAWCNSRLGNIKDSQKVYGGAPIVSTEADVVQLWKESQGLCAACGKKATKIRDLHLDHDHETGRVRGFVCNPCNVAIGMAKDSPRRLRRLARYIERSRQVEQTQLDFQTAAN